MTANDQIGYTDFNSVQFWCAYCYTKYHVSHAQYKIQHSIYTNISKQTYQHTYNRETATQIFSQDTFLDK